MMITKISQATLLLLCFLSSTLALFTPNLEKKHFFVSSENHLSQELFQTHNGIIAHSIENDGNQTELHFFSQYVLIDVQSREAIPILTEIVNECEVAAPVFQHLHYHNQTDSLVYFCHQNASLLILDQTNFEVQSSITFNTQGDWSIAKLSTDGQNVAILRMDTLFSENPQSSTLLKVDMQEKQVNAEISLQSDDPVVAFASNPDAAYVATTRRTSPESLKTTIYSMTLDGTTPTLTQLATWETPIADQPQVIIKLFCLGNYVAINIGQDLIQVYKTGEIAKKTQLTIKPITSDPSGLFQASMTSQYNSTDLYAITNSLTLHKYCFDGQDVNVIKIGSYADMQIASGNQTSGDLIFALDSSRRNFNILNLATLETLYKAVSGFTDGMFTSTTYAIVANSFINIFDRFDDSLISSTPINNNFYYSKEQNLVSFFFPNKASPTCNLHHVNLTSGLSWTSLEVTRIEICTSTILTLTFNQFGPQFAVSAPPAFYLYAFCNGFIQFVPPPEMVNDTKALNGIMFNLFIGFYFFDADSNGTNITATKYIYQGPFYKWKIVKNNIIKNVPADKGLFPLNSTFTLALSNETLTIIKDLAQEKAPEKHSIPTDSDWNSADAFQDDRGAHYVILSKDGSNTTLFTAGQFVPLPGIKNENSTAKTAGYQSYWVSDAPTSSVGFTRFYSASGSNRGREEALISL